MFPLRRTLSLKTRIGASGRLKRKGKRRASSLMEVLVSLVVFSIIMASVIRVIGTVRFVRDIQRQKRHQIEIAHQILLSIATGERFAEYLLPVSDGNKFNSLVADMDHTDWGILNRFFSEKADYAYIVAVDAEKQRYRIFRRTLRTDPWLIEVRVFAALPDTKSITADIAPKPLLSTLFSEKTMPTGPLPTKQVSPVNAP